jgi:hypothetical protein
LGFDRKGLEEPADHRTGQDGRERRYNVFHCCSTSPLPADEASAGEPKMILQEHGQSSARRRLERTETSGLNAARCAGLPHARRTGTPIHPFK